MKPTKQLLLFFGIVLSLVACKKDDAVTKPVEFTETSYANLGIYDSAGKPSGLFYDSISSTLMSFIDATLPEGKNLTLSHPELFSSSAIADIAITQTTDVYVTFVQQIGTLNNALAFYTYPTTQPPASAKEIKKITYFFPNAGGLTTLTAGDKIKIGTFSAGTSIGFVLMQDAWHQADATLDNKAVHFCTNDILNPEVDPAKKKHAVIINYAPENKVLVGFDDLDRTVSYCDNDFNDVVFYCTLALP